MKKKEKKILKHMRNGKRLNISGIARSLNLPVSTVSGRISAIEKAYVAKRPSLLKYHALGFFAHAQVAVRVSQENKSKLLAFLKKESCVNSIYHINSDYDFMIEVVFRNLMQLKEWVEDSRKMFGIDAAVFQILKIEEREVFMSK